MITLKDWMECVNYKITEGSEYLWTCFGDRSYNLSYWNGDQDGHSSNIVFDTTTQEVYIAEVCDYKNYRAYRLINKDYLKEYKNYAANNSTTVDEAWDDIKFIDLETDEDWIKKTMAIVNDLPYDTRVSVPIDLNDEELLALFMKAHERDITFNQLVEEILTNAVENININAKD